MFFLLLPCINRYVDMYIVHSCILGINVKNVTPYFPSTPTVSECQLCGWWSWAGNSVERWGGQVERLIFPPLQPSPLGWRSTFTRRACTSLSSWAAATLQSSSAWKLPRNAVSDWAVGSLMLMSNNHVHHPSSIMSQMYTYQMDLKKTLKVQ